MPLTSEQRAEINRENSKKSTGPKSDAGKAASRRNATRHGLRAEALALPNEDPEVVAARAESWNAYYQPQSPAAQHLVNACVAATLMSDRCQRYHTAALTRQVRDAEHAWFNQREDRVMAAVKLLRTDPETAIMRLVRFSQGCRYLIERWEALLGALDTRKSWSAAEADEAVRLQGFRPEPEHLKACPPAWVTVVYGLLTHKNPSNKALSELFRSDRYPEEQRSRTRIDFYPDPDACAAKLREMVVAKLEPLRELEEDCLALNDDPDREAAADRAAILYDGPQARLFLRYHSESRTAFHRAYSSLVQALDRDAAVSESDADTEVSPNEANPSKPEPQPEPQPVPVPEPAEANSPNEANPAPPTEPKPSKSRTSRTPQTAPAEPVAPSTTPALSPTGGEAPPLPRQVA